MIETLEERKSRLKGEINIAKDLLFNNINSTKLTNYLPNKFSILSNITQRPGLLVSGLLSATRLFLSKNNKMNHLMSIYNIISPFFKQK